MVVSFYFHHLSTMYVVIPYLNSLSLSLTLFISLVRFLYLCLLFNFLSLQHLHSLRTNFTAPARVTVPKGATVDLVRDKYSYAYACRVDERMRERAWRFGLWTGYAHCPLTLLAVSWP